MLGSSGEGPSEARDNNGGGGGGGDAGPSTTGTGGSSEEEKLRIEEELGDRSCSGGNRWPRQETLALLKIRSDMDVAFRDSSLKGPLWEQVSRKLAELGYNRSAKKCKEKFENVYKYHKRTKDVRSSKPVGKTYRYFEQLEALENQPSSLPLLPPPQPQPQSQPQPSKITHQASQAIPLSVVAPMPNTTIPPPPIVSHITVSSTPNPSNVSQSPNIQGPLVPAIPSSSSFHPNTSASFASISSSSSTSSDEERPERRRKRKRKWEGFFQRVMREVIEKQEGMQKKFLETLERRERERVAREEAWRVQEIARMNREKELLVQERSMAAARDAAVIAFLQKVSQRQIPNISQMQMSDHHPIPPIVPPPPPVQQALVIQAPPPPVPPQQQQQQQQLQLQLVKSIENPKTNNGGENLFPASSSRWPKAEVEALIRLRTDLDIKYQENGPKGPLWEEISAGMSKLGYSRNPKRCKEKWENINKYFKKVKESNKKRPEDSKTCPYFHQLDALYKEKAKTSTDTCTMKLENVLSMEPIMVQPEQQWPAQVQQQQHRPESLPNMEGHDEEEDEDEEDDEDEASGYQIVTNKGSSVDAIE